MIRIDNIPELRNNLKNEDKCNKDKYKKQPININSNQDTQNFDITKNDLDKIILTYSKKGDNDLIEQQYTGLKFNESR